MHSSAAAWFKDRAAQLPHVRSIVEIGGRNINGAIRHLFSADRYLCIDLYPGPGVDLVADACEWSPPETPDLVLCSQVLEHAPRAAEMIARVHDWLVPGGLLLIATVGGSFPPHSGYDGGPVRPSEFYCGVESADLASWLDPFQHFSYRCDDNGDRLAVGIKRPAKGGKARWTMDDLWPGRTFIDVRDDVGVPA